MVCHVYPHAAALAPPSLQMVILEVRPGCFFFNLQPVLKWKKLLVLFMNMLTRLKLLRVNANEMKVSGS